MSMSSKNFAVYDYGFVLGAEVFLHRCEVWCNC